MDADSKCIGKVIRILDKYTLLINVGSSNIKVGDNIQVYELGEPIEDLDGNIISYFFHIKDELKVVETQDCYSVCKKNKTVAANFTAALALSPILESKVIERPPLLVDEKEINPLEPKDKMIHIGDLVKLA